MSQSMAEGLGGSNVVFIKEREGMRLSASEGHPLPPTLRMSQVSQGTYNTRTSPRAEASSPINVNMTPVMETPQPIIVGRNLQTASTWTTGPPGLVTGHTKKNQYEVFEESAWAGLFKDLQDKNKVRLFFCVCMYVWLFFLRCMHTCVFILFIGVFYFIFEDLLCGNE
jgi:hypothetical protein